MATIRMRRQIEVNTDPQRRCYDGCHAKSEIRWTTWENLESGLTLEALEPRLKFWRELNAYAVRERGPVGTLCEFDAVEDMS